MDLSYQDYNSEFSDVSVSPSHSLFSYISTSYFSLPYLSSSIGSKLFSNSYNFKSFSYSKSFNIESRSFNIDSISFSLNSIPLSTDILSSDNSLSFSYLLSTIPSQSSSSLPNVPEYKTVTVSMEILNETSGTFSPFKQFILITSFSNLLNIDSSHILIKSITDKYIANSLRFLSISGITVILDFQVDQGLETEVSNDIMYLFASGSLKNELMTNGLSVDISLNELYIDQNPIAINDDLISGDDGYIGNDDGSLITGSDESSNDDPNYKMIGSIIGSFLIVFVVVGAYIHRKRSGFKLFPVPKFAEGPTFSNVIPYFRREGPVNVNVDNSDNRFVTAVA
jgi:hypothetical protein